MRAHTESELLPLLETLYVSKNATRRWLHCARRDWIFGKLRECARGGRGRALEAGFGAGVYLPLLAELYEEVVATDLDDAHLNHARPLAAEHPNLRLVKDDITDSRLPERSFNLVLCSEVVEHIADSAGALRRIHRLLAPGGTLVLSTPQRFSALELTCKVALLPGVINLARVIYGEPVFQTGHINLMTERQVSRQLREAGFRIRERAKFGMYVPLAAEFAGAPGLRMEQWLERKLRGGALDWLLWTQCYVAEA